MILGLHYFFDGDKCINSYGEVDHNTIKFYAKTAVEALESGLFKIFGHPDVFMFSYKNINCRMSVKIRSFYKILRFYRTPKVLYLVNSD